MRHQRRRSTGSLPAQPANRTSDRIIPPKRFRLGGCDQVASLSSVSSASSLAASGGAIRSQGCAPTPSESGDRSV